VNALFQEQWHRQLHWDKNWAMDLRHVAWLRDFMCSRHWGLVAEVGVFDGISSLALLAAANLGRIDKVAFCDIAFRQSFHAVVKRFDRKKVAQLYACASRDFLPKVKTAECFILDGDHSEKTVKAELAVVLAYRPACVIAHDITAQLTGCSGCEGPAYAFLLMQRAGYFCLSDCLDRPNENTKRGTLIACRDLADYQLALKAFRTTCW
jgi:hypothetical protein